MKNQDLKQIYDSQELNFHSGFNESMMIVNMLDSWQGLDVLEIGCGHGHLASILSYAGANMVAADYSLDQTLAAKDNYPKIDFIQAELSYIPEIWKELFDVVVMQGILEHLDEPWQELDRIMENLLKPDGICCLSVPHWTNPRGYIYHALRLLFDAKMSLTDLHYFLPEDFKKYCEANPRKRIDPDSSYDGHVISYGCQFSTCDESWAGGEEMIADFRERLPKALEDFGIYVPKFLEFLEKMLPDISECDGACLGVKISK